MPKPKLRLMFLLCFAPGTALLAQDAADPQGYSYDGKRWYEVEVSVFSNAYVPSANAEVAAPEKTRPGYLPRLRELQAPGASFDVEFPSEKLPDATLPAAGQSLPGQAAALPEEPPLPLYGPLYSPALAGSFHIEDFARSAYLDLSAQVAQFVAINRNLNGSGKQRVLWHKTWRQPLEGRAQAPAVFVGGGDEYGSHSELEGSLRLADNAGSVMLDANIWLSRFTRDLPEAEPQWHIPDRPFPLAQQPGAVMQPLSLAPLLMPTRPDWLVIEVWQLEETRQLSANQLYYLDHPALGVLIQVRPYQLPARETAADAADF